MSGLLRDLYGHQAWADAEQWRRLEAYPPALEDAKIRERLHHIHYVQRVFLWTTRDQGRVEFERTRPADFATPALLKAYARAYHDDVLPWIGNLDEAALARRVSVPWWKEPRPEFTVEEALAQAATHSHYHRAQNATRLRELGGEPTVTDLIVWYMKGRPAPEWP